MNEVLSVLNNHRSIRMYTDEPVAEEQLEAILGAIQSAPSSINGQQTTVIVLRDKERKRKASELVGNQLWVDQAPVFLVLCADFHRAKLALEKTGEDLVITDSVESILVGATDVGIALGFAMAAAESLGLGIVPIGGVRRSPLEMIELLNLPKLVFPVCGLVVGHPADPAAFATAKKPRLPKSAVIHDEIYNQDLDQVIDDYDEVISNYMSELSDGTNTTNWSQGLCKYYKLMYYPHVRAMLDKQGFDYK